MISKQLTLLQEWLASCTGDLEAARRISSKSAPMAAAKRLYDLSLSAVGLILLSPVFLLIALAIKLGERGPVFYRQTRIGQYGIPFVIWKFRTMTPDADKQGPAITSENDLRVTRLGWILRRTKLDELPQLWNVLRGDMSLVGPRPEVPRYFEHYTTEQRAILQYRPGITDLASLRFRNEEALLQGSADSEVFYVQQCIPRKLKLNEDYASHANLLTDTWIILQTICPYWVGVLAVYAILLTGSFWLSCLLVRNFAVQSAWHDFAVQAPGVVAIESFFLLARRHCKGLLCYFGLPELRQIVTGLILACLLLLMASAVARGFLPPQNLTVVNLCVSLLGLSGFRVLLRRWRERTEGASAPVGPQTRVGIIGAGSVGAQLARCLNTQKGFGRTAVAFFDDDVGKWQKHIHEIPIVGMPECLLQGWSEKIDEVAIALPHVSARRLQEINQMFQNTKLRVYTVQWPLPESPRSEPRPLTATL